MQHEAVNITIPMHDGYLWQIRIRLVFL